MKAERVVVDTNVLIAALLNPQGTPRRLIAHLAERRASLLFSEATFAELAIRLVKPKFDPYRTRAQADAFLDWLTALGEWHQPAVHIRACRDPDDDKFLALAVSAQADCLITGDSDLLSLHPFEGVPILRPVDYPHSGSGP